MKQVKKIFVVFLALITSGYLSAQCAMCNATASTATEGSTAKALALNNGILFLMAIPYLLLTTMVIIWWRYSKQKKAEQ